MIDQYWPYNEQQSQSIGALILRMKNWQKITEKIIGFFIGMKGIEINSAKEYNQLESFLGEFEFEINIQSTFQQIKQNLSGLQSEHSILVSHINETILKKLNSLLTSLSKKSKELKSELEKQRSQILQCRKDTLGYINTHEKTYKTSLPQTDQIPMDILEMDKPSVANDDIDPWLTERVLNVKLKYMIQQENEFRSKVAAVIETIKETERNAINEVQVVLADYIGLKKSHAIENAKLQTILSILNAIDPASLFRSQDAIFDFKSELKLSDFPYSISEIQILKEGVLQRRGKFKKGTWKPIWIILTDSGFLHCFEYGKNGIGKSKKNVKNSDAGDLKYDGIKTNLALFSVCLKQPIVKVEFISDPVFLNVFEIVVHHRVKTPFQIGDPKIRTLKYKLRAASEEEMIDWVAEIHKKIASYIPDGPPEPPFKSPNELLETLDEKLRDSHPTKEVHHGLSDKTLQHLSSGSLDSAPPPPVLSPSPAAMKLIEGSIASIDSQNEVNVKNKRKLSKGKTQSSMDSIGICF
ncbi:hypothetical protein HK098_004330 [Nowakowskiella sp. JEL0407]|nr:hypothetical protein HK098_004330 [Nowakowskiella sp. JEL0407]